jgi:hypothetical protein
MIIILVFRPDGFKWIQGICEAISKDRVPGVGTARYFIVIAERKGFPPVEQIIELVHKNTNAPSAHEQPSIERSIEL